MLLPTTNTVAPVTVSHMQLLRAPTLALFQHDSRVCGFHNIPIYTTPTGRTPPHTSETGAMVQLYDYDTWRFPGAKDYWKLDSGNRLGSRGLRDKLRDGNYSVLKSVNNSRLRALYVRCQRGLLSFEGMAPHLLRLYATQRGLTVASAATPNSIKAQLEQADDDATFDRFTDLPPEIRQVVYQYYFDSSLANETPRYKYQPPLTMISRTVRRESLPLFYDCWRIDITSEGPLTDPYKFRPSAITTRLLQSIAAQDLARVKSIQLWFNALSTGVAIDIRNEDPIGRVDIYRAGYGFMNEATRARRERLLAALRVIALSMATRPGPLRFRLTDVGDVGETIRRIIIGETKTQ